MIFKNETSDKKYPLVRSKLIPLGFLVVAFFFTVMWLGIRTSENVGLLLISNLFFPFLIGFAIFGAILQFFVISKLYFVRLTNEAMVVYRVFPNSFKYSDIKNISFSNGWLKGIDTGLYMSWPILMRIESSEDFLKELKSKYKSSTGKNLIIKEYFA